jgi:hypothetical protein
VTAEFKGRLISRFGEVTCPAHLPDLAIPGYFLWGYIKSKIYETCPSNIDDLQRQIWEKMQGNPMEMLHATTDFLSQMQERTEKHCGHLQSVISKPKGIRRILVDMEHTC